MITKQTKLKLLKTMVATGPDSSDTARSPASGGSAGGGMAVTLPTVPRDVSAVKYLTETAITI